jgi:hypothetical protein
MKHVRTPESEILLAAENYALAEAQARQALLHLASKIVAMSDSELDAYIPANKEHLSTLGANLHHVLRRLETDAALVGAALARMEAHADERGVVV